MIREMCTATPPALRSRPGRVVLNAGDAETSPSAKKRSSRGRAQRTKFMGRNLPPRQIATGSSDLAHLEAERAFYVKSAGPLPI